jgi:hypothetical protein
MAWYLGTETVLPLVLEEEEEEEEEERNCCYVESHSSCR